MLQAFPVNSEKDINEEIHRYELQGYEVHDVKTLFRPNVTQMSHTIIFKKKEGISL
jgi:hypothetical protein